MRKPNKKIIIIGLVLGASLITISVFAILHWIRQEPVELGAFFKGGDSFNLFVDGNTGYIANGEKGLLIIDLSNPTHPRKLWENESYYIRDVYVSDNIAYLAAWADGLIIFNVTNPSNPEFIGKFSNNTHGFSIYVSGNFAYVVGYQGMSIINVNIASNPIELHLNFKNKFIFNK